MSKDDEYWHTIMHQLGEDFIAEGLTLSDVGDEKRSQAWIAAGKEVKATADQALKTAGTAERLVNSKPN